MSEAAVVVLHVWRGAQRRQIPFTFSEATAAKAAAAAYEEEEVEVEGGGKWPSAMETLATVASVGKFK